MLANGRKRILYIAPDSRERRKFPPFGPEETYHSRMRAGICEALADSGAKLHNLITTPGKAIRDLNKVLDSFRPDGIFVFHDYYAVKVYHALASRNIRPGRQTDVIGCFNTSVGQAWLTPNLTTVNFNPDQLLAALDEYLDSAEENFKVRIKPQLIIRNSVKKSCEALLP